MFKLISRNKMVWFESTQLAKIGNLSHGFSTRLCGVSPYPYSSLNLGLYTNDTLENIQTNRLLFSKSIGVDATKITTVKQVHGDKILKINSSFMANPYLSKEQHDYEADALITNERGIGLFINYADCVPLLFVDRVNEVIAAAHAGWKGTMLGIGKKVVEKMMNDYGSNPTHVSVAIGPSIGPKAFEVGEEVIDILKTHTQAYTEVLYPSKKIGHAYLDLWKINQWQLESVGIKKENIDVARLSTADMTELFYSHRKRIGKETGRMGALIALK